MNPEELDLLVQEVQAGNAAAYDRVVAALSREVASFVAAHASSIGMIDEVVQNAFVGAYRSLARYEPRGTFAAWVKGFARNALRKQLSERARMVSSDVEVLDALLAERATAQLDQEPADSWHTAAAEHLPTCLQRLPAQSREIALRRFAQDIPLNVLAQQFKRSRASIACLLTRIRMLLQDCIESRVQATRRGQP